MTPFHLAGVYIGIEPFCLRTEVASDKAPSSGANDGIDGDWGKTRPYWCLTCGRGYKSIERVVAHYAADAHGNESMSVGSKGLTKKQQLEAFRLKNR